MILGSPYFFGTSIGMNSSPSVAANLANDARKGLAILSLSKAEPIAHLADREGVRRRGKIIESIRGSLAL